MSRRLQKLMKELSNRDFNALKLIYDFRCLSFDQVFDQIYKYNEVTGNENTTEYFQKKIRKMKRMDIVEEEEDYKLKFPVYFLTTDGVKLIREYFSLPNNIYDKDKQMHKRGYLKYSELKLSPRLISHQYYLNDFVIDTTNKIQKYAKEHNENKDVKYVYEDEKHIKRFVGIRPDGILSLYDVDFFLEMDMGTESVDNLNEKWDHYREFTTSKEFINKERKIAILFIVEGVSNVERRIHLIKKTIQDRIIDLPSLSFDFHIGTKDELQQILLDEIIPQQKNTFKKDLFLKRNLIENKNYKVLKSDIFNEHIKKAEFKLYLKGNENNEEYLLDYGFSNSMSMYKKIYFSDQINNVLSKTFNKTIPIVFVVDSLEKTRDELELFGLNDFNNVFFTTLKDVKNNQEFYKSLHIVKDGGIYQVLTPDLKNIAKKEDS